MNTEHGNTTGFLTRHVEAVLVPAGAQARITQSLGGTGDDVRVGAASAWAFIDYAP